MAMNKESLLKEAKKKFPQYYEDLLFDFINDIFSEKVVWEVYGIYFGYDFSSPIKRWAYDICVCVCKSKSTDIEWDAQKPLKVSELISVLERFDQDAVIRVSNGNIDIYDFAVADDDDGVIIAF